MRIVIICENQTGVKRRYYLFNQFNISWLRNGSKLLDVTNVFNGILLILTQNFGGFHGA